MKETSTIKASKIESLPNEVLERCLSFLDTEDLCKGVEPTCRSFREVSNEAHVWESIALRKYGGEILAEARGVYNSHRHMVADDMKRVAGQAINMAASPACGPWIYNRPELYYVCLVLGIQYYRPTDEIRIYIEARGERDLRHPSTSSVTFFNSGDRKRTTAKGFVGTSYGPGHYRGYVSFDATFFEQSGGYYFLYADPEGMDGFVLLRDYETIFIRKKQHGKERLWGTIVHKNKFSSDCHEADNIYALDSWSPFVTNSDNESQEAAELERFRPFVTFEVWNRHIADNGRSRKWWVARNSRNDHSVNGESQAYSAFMDSLVLMVLAGGAQNNSD